MLPQSPIELSLFDFVDEFARGLEGGVPEGSDSVVDNSTVVMFCESFFDQLFASVLHCPITGFDTRSKHKAARLAEKSRTATPLSQELRKLVSLFESFCDMYQDVIKGSYGAGEITYSKFHQKYMSRLLERAELWAGQEGYSDLQTRIAAARTRYDEAVEGMLW